MIRSRGMRKYSTVEEKAKDFLKMESIDKEGHIIKMTMCNPAKLNAIGESDSIQFLSAMEAFHSLFPSARVAILTGEGRAFSAGGDFDFIRQREVTSPEANAYIMVCILYFIYFTFYLLLILLFILFPSIYLLYFGLFI